MALMYSALMFVIENRWVKGRGAGDEETSFHTFFILNWLEDVYFYWDFLHVASSSTRRINELMTRYLLRSTLSYCNCIITDDGKFLGPFQHFVIRVPTFFNFQLGAFPHFFFSITPMAWLKVFSNGITSKCKVRLVQYLYFSAFWQLSYPKFSESPRAMPTWANINGAHTRSCREMMEASSLWRLSITLE